MPPERRTPLTVGDGETSREANMRTTAQGVKQRVALCRLDRHRLRVESNRRIVLFSRFFQLLIKYHTSYSSTTTRWSECGGGDNSRKLLLQVRA